VTVDRTKAMEHGMTVAQIYMQVAAALNTSTSGTEMELDDSSMQLIIQQDESSNYTVETLPELKIDPDSTMSSAMSGGSSSSSSSLSSLSGSGDEDTDSSFLLKDVATVEKTVSLNTINRDQQRRCVTVTAAIAEGNNVTLVSDQVTKAVNAMELPEGASIEFNGENEQIMDAMGQVMLMLLLGIVLVYFVMVAQFQSLREPFIVMFTIPLAFTGGFLALLLTGTEMSVIALIGFVMLVGIIVNNGIVLVDYINQQRLAGMERRDAIIDAGVTRLRPILMTSLTTILGLIVTALAKNAGTSLIQPVALVCIGGLLYATLMTLFVVPCMYELVSKKKLRKVDERELEILED
jgi:multidrug efflux pump subunit AcrB